MARTSFRRTRSKRRPLELPANPPRLTSAELDRADKIADDLRAVLHLRRMLLATTKEEAGDRWREDAERLAQIDAALLEMRIPDSLRAVRDIAMRDPEIRAAHACIVELLTDDGTDPERRDRLVYSATGHIYNQAGRLCVSDDELWAAVAKADGNGHVERADSVIAQLMGLSKRTIGDIRRK